MKKKNDIRTWGRSGKREKRNCTQRGKKVRQGQAAENWEKKGGVLQEKRKLKG